MKTKLKLKLRLKDGKNKRKKARENKNKLDSMEQRIIVGAYDKNINYRQK